MDRNSEEKFKVPKSFQGQSNFSNRILKDLKDTIAFGEHLIEELPNLKLLLLQGELGAGKTSLVKGIAKGIGIKEPITSPTFALSQYYPTGSRPLLHIDLYRLENYAIANELFLQEEEEITALEGIMVVEWPERLTLKLPDAWVAKLKYTNNSERFIQLFEPSTEERKDLTWS